MSYKKGEPSSPSVPSSLSLSSLPSYHATIWKNRLSRASFGKRYRRDQQPLLGFGRSFENRSADCVPFPWSSMPSGLTASPKFQGISPSPLSQCPPTFASHTTPELWQKSGEPLTQFFFQFMARPGVSLSPFFFPFFLSKHEETKISQRPQLTSVVIIYQTAAAVLTRRMFLLGKGRGASATPASLNPNHDWQLFFHLNANA